MYSRNNLASVYPRRRSHIERSPDTCINFIIVSILSASTKISFPTKNYWHTFSYSCRVICSRLLLTTGYKTSGKVYIYKNWSYLWSQFDLQDPSKHFNKLQIRDLNKFGIQCFIWSQQQQDW